MKKDELWKDEASKMVNHFWNRMPIFRNTARTHSFRVFAWSCWDQIFVPGGYIPTLETKTSTPQIHNEHDIPEHLLVNRSFHISFISHRLTLD